MLLRAQREHRRRHGLGIEALVGRDDLVFRLRGVEIRRRAVRPRVRVRPASHATTGFRWPRRRALAANSQASRCDRKQAGKAHHGPHPRTGAGELACDRVHFTAAPDRHQCARSRRPDQLSKRGWRRSISEQSARGLSVQAGWRLEGWWSQAGSNRRPLACHASALPAELWPRNLASGRSRNAGGYLTRGRRIKSPRPSRCRRR